MNIITAIDVGIKKLGVVTVIFDSKQTNLCSQFDIPFLTLINLTKKGENANKVPLTTLSDRASLEIEQWAKKLSTLLSNRFNIPIDQCFNLFDVIGIEQQCLVSANASHMKQMNHSQTRARQNSNHRINALSFFIREHFVTQYKKYGGQDTSKVKFVSAQAKDYVISYGESCVPSKKSVRKYGIPIINIDLSEWKHQTMIYKAKKKEIKQDIETYRLRKKFSIKQARHFFYTQTKCKQWLEWYEKLQDGMADVADALRHALRIIIDQCKLNNKTKKRKNIQVIPKSIIHEAVSLLPVPCSDEEDEIIDLCADDHSIVSIIERPNKRRIIYDDKEEEELFTQNVLHIKYE